jgi:flagella basal body P-ring formation protein FlgA
MGHLLLAALACTASADEKAAIRALPVPTSTIPAGQVVRNTDLTERRFHTTDRSLLGMAVSSAQVEGKEARRRLLAGKPIPLSALTKPILLRRGAKVTASYEDAGLSISTQLVALEDGSEGDTISLRNTSTGAVVIADILNGGSIRVRME